MKFNDFRQLTKVSQCDKKLLVKTYTINLVDLHIQQTIVVGGGKVAARKVEGLLAAEARVKVISPLLVSELQAWVDSGTIDFIQRPYQDGDLEGAYLVIAATGEKAVNHAVWGEATTRGCLINVVDDPEHSTFILPAILRRGDLSIAISTGGNSPALARRLRERLESVFGPEYGTLTELLALLRPELIENYPPGQDRLQAALRIIDSEILPIIIDQGKDAALTYAREQLHQRA